MWHVLRTELYYFLPWLFGGLGIAVGITILLSVLLGFLGGGERVPSFLPGMFPILAGMVVSFIAQSLRFEERRARLLLAGPVTPGQLGWVTVLLPACLVALGALAAIPMLGLAALIGSKVEPASFRMLGALVGQFFAYAQIGPLVQEAVAAKRQGRLGAATAAWSGIVLALPFLTAFYWLESQPMLLVLSYLVAIAMVMSGCVALYRGRTDFTR